MKSVQNGIKIKFMRQIVKIPCIDSTQDEICAKQDQYETSPFTHLMEKNSHRNTYYCSSCESLSNLLEYQSKILALNLLQMKSVQNRTKMRKEHSYIEWKTS